MAAIEPPEPRATVVKEPTGLRITIPVKRRWFMLLFLTVCLGFWGVGGGTTLLKTLRGERGDDWLTLAFLAVWVASSAFGVYVWPRPRISFGGSSRPRPSSRPPDTPGCPRNSPPL
jgi:hypothetical protein